MCEVARNSPDGEKSIDNGAFLNLNQSMSEPVTISHTRIHLSRLEQRSQRWSGCEKQTSVILLCAQLSNCLTLVRPVFALSNVIERSDVENATRSLNLL
jgi:hypothetical protein